MLPRPSTRISLQPCSATPLRSACLTIDPSGSLRVSSWPVTSRRPSASQSVAHPRPGGPCPTTSLLPSRSTATISCVPQLENQRRPSCQRGDSPIARPLSRICGSGTEDSFLREPDCNRPKEVALMSDCATPKIRYETPTALPLEAAFDGGRITIEEVGVCSWRWRIRSWVCAMLYLSTHASPHALRPLPGRQGRGALTATFERTPGVEVYGKLERGEQARPPAITDLPALG